MTTIAEWDRGHALEGVVSRSSHPVALIDLVDLQVVAGSPSAAAILGRSDLEGLAFLTALVDSDGARSAVALLRSGAVEAYEAQRVFAGTDGADRAVTLWVRGLSRKGFADWALALLRLTEDPRGPCDDAIGPPPLRTRMAVGTGDVGGKVDLFSAEIEAMLGVTSSSFCAEPLSSWVHPDDAELLTTALRRSQDTGAPEVVTARLRTDEGEWSPVRIVMKVGPAAAGSRVGLAVLDEAPQPDGHVGDTNVAGLVDEIRALDLVDAMAYLPAMRELPAGAEKLTEREWEIVARLLRGDRGPAIASALYLAPSTVRNHLVAVFRKVGVNSQQELIFRFRGET